MISGELQPLPWNRRVINDILFAAFLLPWLLMGGGSTLVGALAVGPRRGDDLFSGLRICLPAGLALLAGVGWMAYSHFWSVPRRTVQAFEFANGILSLQTPRGSASVSAKDLLSLSEQRGVRGHGLLGWWLRFHRHHPVYLPRAIDRGAELVERLRAPGSGQYA